MTTAAAKKDGRLSLPVRAIIGLILGIVLAGLGSYVTVRLGGNGAMQNAVVSAVFVFFLLSTVNSWSQTAVITTLGVAAIVGVLVYSPTARTTVSHGVINGATWAKQQVTAAGAWIQDRI